jgi:hypothetical protein
MITVAVEGTLSDLLLNMANLVCSSGFGMRMNVFSNSSGSFISTLMNSFTSSNHAASFSFFCCALFSLVLVFFVRQAQDFKLDKKRLAVVLGHPSCRTGGHVRFLKKKKKTIV